MNPDRISRRTFVQATTASAAGALAAHAIAQQTDAQKPSSGAPSPPDTFPPPLLTPAADFRDVSRGNPKPHTLVGKALEDAKLTADTWRLEISADPFTSEVVKVPAKVGRSFTLADGTALDLPALLELGKKHAVRYLKAMQCLNIATPLGNGLWEGVPLREVLKLCGKLENVRRIYYWGFHNNDPKQLFRSSISYTQAMETPPGELPAFLAYRLNGEPISPLRGGPVRMVIPWAFGFKSIKWLQHISLTNDYQSNDTYAEANNDPESHQKTAAYLDPVKEKNPLGRDVFISGQVVSGLSGFKRVEYWVRPAVDPPVELAEDAPVLLAGPWRECQLHAPPSDWRDALPTGVSSKEVLGFDKSTGQPLSWPLRYSMAAFSAKISGLAPGKYEVRARTVDLNGFAQPEPRAIQKSGRNAIQVKRFEVT